MSITRKTFTHPAASGQGQIFSRVWTGEAPKYILQIAHGKCEHSGRYDDFDAFMAENGFAVYMNDHVGHGETARLNGDPFGHFGDKNGWENTVKDMKSLTDIAKKEHPGLPVVLLGHSMGSFLARSYIARYGKELSGCVICGTMGTGSPAGVAKALATLQCIFKGPKSPAPLLTRLTTGSNDEQMGIPDDGTSWLSTDPAVCKAFAEDPLCGFEFTAGGFKDLFTGVAEISSKSWAKKVPINLPLFFIAGADDPVGNYGKGPVQVADMLKAAGVRDIEVKIYPGMRHEILNEREKQIPYADVLNWFKRHLPQK